MSTTQSYATNVCFSGNAIAVVTPFTATGELDLDSFDHMIKLYSQSQVDTIVICGTTGESPTLSHEEHKILVERGVKTAHSVGLKAIAGTGSNSTKEAVALTQAAKSCGADGCLIASPYYNKPSPRGVREHFKALNAVGIPLVIYNIPGRSAINLAPELIIELLETFDQTVALKASNGNLEDITDVVDRAARRNLTFNLLSGDDSITLPILAVGGVGTISVIANIMPKVIGQMVAAARAEQFKQAAAISTATFGLCKLLFSTESSPAPTKFLMQRLGLIKTAKLRLPLVEMAAGQSVLLCKEYNDCISRLQKLNITLDDHLKPLEV